ncbi:hypothetical protein EYC84_007955 [Monilinia fructicola]|uniref:WSC domain-containing protein n=1 Tax=Monilinia fructicola TaxID=38448 RepID=A0A5M9JMJ8_MONFR|nr:hypothetical protein EYC84_007955 [Monilinia fructicola]
MKSTLLSSLIFLTTFSRVFNVNASFNLNTSGPDWDYVAKDLANTTSQACIAAYSTGIDCDATLLGLVASMRPAFKPTSTDFDNTCTTTCSDSLDAYLKGVQEACSAGGDAAQEYVGGSTPEALVPVEIVAQVFRNGTYCYNVTSSSSASSFSCDDECAGQEYQIAHDYPGSAYQFNYYWLKLQLQVQQLRVNRTTSTSSITLSGSSITTLAISNSASSPSRKALAESSSTTPTAASVTTSSGAIELEHSLELVFLGIFSAMFMI